MIEEGTGSGKSAVTVPNEPAERTPKTRASIATVIPGVGLIAHYDRAWLRPDMLAALSVWALLIPQGMAYAQIAGVPAVTGLYVGMFAMGA
jgi:hypothetical protein